MRSRFSTFVLLGLVFSAPAPAVAQDRCENFMCTNGAQATGDFPSCFCGTEALPVQPEGPSCERDIQCADPTHIAVGTWPACGCRKPDDAPSPPGSGGGPAGGDSVPFHPGLGGVDNCSAVFECPPQFKMAVEDDTCICSQ